MLAAAILLVVIGSIFSASWKGGPYEMDPGGRQGTFFPLLILYDLAAYAIAVADAGVAYVGWTHHVPGPDLLISGMVIAMLIPVWLTLCYESYLMLRYPTKESIPACSTYSNKRYVITCTLAVTAILLFVGGTALTVTEMMR